MNARLVCALAVLGFAVAPCDGRAQSVNKPPVYYELVWVDQHGSEMPVDPSFRFRLTEYGGNTGWALSPDGTRLAIGIHTDSGDAIWMKNLQRPGEPAVRLSRLDSLPEFRPRWSPHGDSVRFIRAFNANTPNARTMLLAEAVVAPYSEAPVLELDSGNIFESLQTANAGTMVIRTGGVVGLTGARQVMSIRKMSATGNWATTSSFPGAAIAISPDGRWLAYESLVNWRPEIVVRAYPDLTSPGWQLSTSGGMEPIWSRDARELYFVNGTHDLVRVRVAANSARPFGSPQVLFPLPDDVYFVEGENYTPFDVAADGRFIMARLVPRDSSARTPGSTHVRNGAQREVDLRFDGTGGGIRDANGQVTGFTARLPGSGARLGATDSNLVVDAAKGELRMTTTRSWFGADAHLDALEAPAIDLRSLGFAAGEDVSISATFTGIQDDRVWDFPDQVGIFVGASPTEAVRAGFWNVDAYAAPGETRSNRPFAVLTNGPKDGLARLGSYDVGDTVAVEISRTSGVWRVRVNGVDRMPNTEQNGSGYPLPPTFLDDRGDLFAGAFAMDGNGKHKAVYLKRLAIRVGQH